MKSLTLFALLVSLSSFANFVHAGAITSGDIIPFPILNPYSLAEHETEQAGKQLPSIRAEDLPQNGWMMNVMSKRGTIDVGIFIEGSQSWTSFDTEAKLRMLQPNGQFSRQLQYVVFNYLNHGKLVEALPDLRPNTNVTGIDRNLVRFDGTVKYVFSNGVALVEHKTQTGEVWYHAWPKDDLRVNDAAANRVESTPAYGAPWETIKTIDDLGRRATGPSRPVTGYWKGIPSPGQLVLISEYKYHELLGNKPEYMIALFEKEYDMEACFARPLLANGSFGQTKTVKLGSKYPYVFMTSEKNGFKQGDRVTGKTSRGKLFEGTIAVIFTNGRTIVAVDKAYRYTLLSELKPAHGG